ncbi:hypothetical protein BJ138DRAFT_116454 [Hygrophoropsis aurantiaca]|uniref:Uncharacterized protein n=1 Tax=Hygrophoropsis aurantiaca TaxID=72124 RepID=A0ACB8AC40_9AGAM|nr:hypothetical protein BJ138DRAFT_116454 [Hygrophoropsis aurantiaca]
MVVVETKTGEAGSDSDSDLPPSYDTLSLQPPHQSTSQAVNTPAIGTSDSTVFNIDDNPRSRSFVDLDKSLPAPPATTGVKQRKSSSWLNSLIPFASSRNAKQIRQSVTAIVHDLVTSPSQPKANADGSTNEILASCAHSCASNDISFSALLQEPSIADHTPIYWAIVQYREELLAALLVHATPLTPLTVSDIRRGCLVTSNQALFHALRLRKSPFHRTDALQAGGLRSATDTLLLGTKPADDVHIRDVGSDGAFIATFEIHMWQKRMRAAGKVMVDFIARGRIWSIYFFSTGPTSSANPGRLKKTAGTWHVAIALLEHSPSTYLDSQLIIEVPGANPRPSSSHANSAPIPRTARGKHHESSYDYNYDGHSSSSGKPPGTPEYSPPSSPRSLRTPPPTHPHRAHTNVNVSPAAGMPILLRFKSGGHKLAYRAPKSGNDAGSNGLPSTKPDTWSEGGMDFTSAVVMPLGEGVGSQLMYDNTQYLTADGTLHARLEARLTKAESSSKDCVIC